MIQEETIKFYKPFNQNDIGNVESFIYPIFLKEDNKDKQYWKEIRSLFLSAMKNADLNYFIRNIFWVYIEGRESVLAFYIYMINDRLCQVMQEMKDVVVDPEDVVKGEMPDSVRVWNDPYGVATDHLYDLHSYKDFKREFTKLELKDQRNIVSKIVENNFI